MGSNKILADFKTSFGQNELPFFYSCRNQYEVHISLLKNEVKKPCNKGNFFRRCLVASISTEKRHSLIK